MSTPTTARFAAALAAIVAAAALTTGSAEAAPPTDAVCTSLMTLQITPGFTIAPGSGSVTSGGQTGALDCAGTEYGHRITGPGTLGVVETYNTASGCLSDVSTGQVTATLPTTAGQISVVGALTEHRVGLLANIEIAFPQAKFSGIAAIAPTEGLCLLLPLTQALVSTTGTFIG